MRHNKNFNHLGRQAGHRKAMLSNMASSLILHKRIETTVAKAKAVRMFIEPLVTKSKEDTTHSRRVVFSYLKQKEAVTELFRTIAPKIASRPGGYTRILKTGFRLGDGADMCIIEFVDFNEAYTLGVAPAAAPRLSPRRVVRAPRSRPMLSRTPQSLRTAMPRPQHPKRLPLPRRPLLRRLPRLPPPRRLLPRLPRRPTLARKCSFGARFGRAPRIAGWRPKGRHLFLPILWRS